MYFQPIIKAKIAATVKGPLRAPVCALEVKVGETLPFFDPIGLSLGLILDAFGS